MPGFSLFHVFLSFLAFLTTAGYIYAFYSESAQVSLSDYVFNSRFRRPAQYAKLLLIGLKANPVWLLLRSLVGGVRFLFWLSQICQTAVPLFRPLHYALYVFNKYVLGPLFYIAWWIWSPLTFIGKLASPAPSSRCGSSGYWNRSFGCAGEKVERLFHNIFVIIRSVAHFLDIEGSRMRNTILIPIPIPGRVSEPFLPPSPVQTATPEVFAKEIEVGPEIEEEKEELEIEEEVPQVPKVEEVRVPQAAVDGLLGKLDSLEEGARGLEEILGTVTDATKDGGL
jgi:hypothetical protein